LPRVSLHGSNGVTVARIPEKYLAGLHGEERQERRREIMRERQARTYAPLPSDRGRTGQRSRWSAEFELVYGKRPASLEDVAALTGRDLAVLRQVYVKGLAAWSSGGHRPGASQHAWAMARVESFVLGGPTALGPDRRLAVAAGIVREK